MRVHLPEYYEAHRLRSREFLIQMAERLGFTYEALKAKNWDIQERIDDMAETGRGRPKKPTQTSLLLDALTFIEPGVADTDNQPWHSYVRLHGNMAVAYSTQIAAGHPIAEELTLSPKWDKLKLALSKADKSLVIAETPGGQLSISGQSKTGKMRALVPCMSPNDMPPVQPDQPCAQIGNILREAFKVCGVFTSEAARNVHEASLLLEANVCTGTNGHCLLQFWHGINLPPLIVLPKLFTQAIVKTTKDITGFGFTWNHDGTKVASFTVWFDGGGWIKTQCYEDNWPNVSSVIDVQTFPVECPAQMFEAIDAVAKFNDEGKVSFGKDKIMSHNNLAEGAQFDVKGIEPGKTFNGKYLKAITPYVKTIDMTTFQDRIFFYGGEPANPVRGAIMGIFEGAPVTGNYVEDAPGASGQVEEIQGDYNIDSNVDIGATDWNVGGQPEENIKCNICDGNGCSICDPDDNETGEPGQGGWNDYGND